MQAQTGAGFVDHIDRLVRQSSIVDVLGGQFRGRFEGVAVVIHTMMFFETGFQTAQDVDRFFEARLRHVDLLKSAGKRMIFLENAAIFRVGRRSDAANVSIGKHRLDQVGCVHDPTRCRAGADNCMNFINKQDRSGIVSNLGDDCFEAFLEIAPIFCAGDQGAHIQRINSTVTQNFRHTLFGDHPGQAFGQSGLADTGFADIKRIVLSSPAKNLNRSLYFQFPANQRVDLAIDCHLIQVARVFFKGGRIWLGIRTQRGIDIIIDALIRQLRHAMRDVIHNVEPIDALESQEVHRLRLLLAKDCNEHVAAGDLFLATRLHMKHGTLQYALEAQCGLHIALLFDRHQWRCFVDVFAQLPSELYDISVAGLQNFVNSRNVEKREQQMLDSHELMPAITSTLKCFVQTEFQFAT